MNQETREKLGNPSEKRGYTFEDFNSKRRESD